MCFDDKPLFQALLSHYYLEVLISSVLLSRLVVITDCSSMDRTRTPACSKCADFNLTSLLESIIRRKNMFRNRNGDLFRSIRLCIWSPTHETKVALVRRHTRERPQSFSISTQASRLSRSTSMEETPPETIG